MTSERSAVTTRTRILEAAHKEIYEHGYQGMRIDAILQKTNLAKGALYHYFPNKLALGYAVVEELLLEQFQTTWNEFAKTYPDPLTAIQQLFIVKAKNYRHEQTFKGCPLNNLNQEMAAIDEGFHQRLERVMTTIYDSIVSALEKGQQQGQVRTDIDPTKISMFIMACYQGIMGTAKCLQAPEILGDLFGTLNEYIDTLRAPKHN